MTVAYTFTFACMHTLLYRVFIEFLNFPAQYARKCDVTILFALYAIIGFETKMFKVQKDKTKCVLNDTKFELFWGWWSYIHVEDNKTVVTILFEFSLKEHVVWCICGVFLCFWGFVAVWTLLLHITLNKGWGTCVSLNVY